MVELYYDTYEKNICEITEFYHSDGSDYVHTTLGHFCVECLCYKPAKIGDKLLLGTDGDGWVLIKLT
jgi:hypothetical protein